jgi:hypothetical protein
MTFIADDASVIGQGKIPASIANAGKGKVNFGIRINYPQSDSPRIHTGNPSPWEQCGGAPHPKRGGWESASDSAE